MTEIPDAVQGLSPSSFRRENVPEDAAADTVAQIFILDVQEQLPTVVRLRDESLVALAPVSGETALDIGCGTGAEVRRLARLVGPEGRAVGVEPHPDLRAEAERRTADEGVEAEFVDADALALPFEDGSVDVVRSERVFQHLPDPEGAIAEIVRVLRPGGRVAIIDSDWGTAIYFPGDPDVVRRLNVSSMSRSANPFAGRTLRGQLTRAGLTVDPDIGSGAVILPDILLSSPAMLRGQTAPAVEAGDITAAEAETLELEMAEAAARGEALGAVTMFSFVGAQARVLVTPRSPDGPLTASPGRG